MADEPSAQADTGALQHIQDEVGRHIKSFSSSKRFFRRLSLLQTVTTAALGALTTFLIGLAQIYERTWLNALSLAFSALATISAAWTGWYGARQAWVANQMALNQLYALRSRIAFESRLSGQPTEAERARTYYIECQRILNEANSQWAQNRTSQT